MVATSRERPIETKKNPRRSPRNGLISVVMTARNGVSDNAMPPRNAPKVDDSPILPALQPAASAISSAVAVKISSFFDWAIRLSAGLTKIRATRTVAAKATAALTTAVAIAAVTPSPFPIASATTRSRIAATSWKRRIAVAVRPTGQFCWWRSAINRPTTAVEDSASVKPTKTAADGFRPKHQAAPPSAAVAKTT